MKVQRQHRRVNSMMHQWGKSNPSVKQAWNKVMRAREKVRARRIINDHD